MRDITVPALTHELGADVDESFDPDGGPWEISGIAVAPGDVLHMDDGTPVLMTEEELREAAPTQADEPLSDNHPTDEDGEYAYPPSPEDTLGRITASGYLDGGPNKRGVGYSGVVHDPETARGYHGGSLRVSVHPKFELGERDPETGAYVGENICFQDLAVVSKGDSPSNTANWGANQQLAAYAHQTDIAAELTAGESAAETGADQSLVSSAVDGTLRALGLTPGDVAVDPSADATAGATDQTDDPDSDTETESMADDTDPADDPSDPADTDPDASEGNGGTTDDEPNDESNTVEVDLGEHDSLDALVASRVEAQVDDAREAADKAEQVDEIIAHAEEYDEDDREDLLASPDSVVETTHKQVTTASAPPAPGTTGRRDEAVASLGDGDDDGLDAYGTGVAEH